MLRDGQFVTTVEMSPPRSFSTQKVIATAEMLRDAGVNFINVSDSPLARMRMSPWAVAFLLRERVGLESVLHFPTRGATSCACRAICWPLTRSMCAISLW
ncbi:MAG: hypothetical protein HC915_06310 [Anaerolineae bacterium]|nr:hypothetical protein [Anaerolineae bacterium]